MSTPAVNRECYAGSHRNSRKTTKFSARCEMRPDSPALRAEQGLIPNQTGKEPWLLDGTSESPPEVPHKCRNTLTSPQECERARCTRNQIEMMTNSPALATEQCPIPHHKGQVAWLPLGISRDSLRHPSQVSKSTKFSTGTRGKLHATHIVSRRELNPRILLKN